MIRYHNYLIADAGGGEKSSKIYFLDKVMVGSWIDGKPLYRKVFKGIIGSVGVETVLLSNGLESISFVVKADLVIFGKNEALVFAPNEFTYTAFVRQSKKLFCRCEANDSANQPVYVILEYTKTTD